MLYLSIGEPRAAVSVDLGDGILARYDEEAKELVGLTVVELRARLLQGLAKR